MRASKLNRAIERGRDAAFTHEARLAERYRAALTQAGRIAARRFTERADASLTAAAPTRESAMVAVYPAPEQQEALAIPNGEPAEIIHCTLAFLGELDPDEAEAAAAVVAEVARTFEYATPLEGEAGGRAAFGSETGKWAEIARVAGMVAPDGGYGDTLWRFSEAAVYWIPADWTSTDETEAAAQAFLAVPGVESVVILDSESAAPAGDDWLLLWANGHALVEAVYPAIMLPDVPGLAELRQAVTEALRAAGIPYAESHGWQPHLTVAYVSEPEPPPTELLGLPLTFAALSFTQGDVARDFPFGEDILVAAGPPPWHPPHPDEVVDVDEIIGRLRTKGDPVRRTAIRQAALPALGEVGLDFDITNPFVNAVLDKTGAEVVNIAETTRLNILRIIRDGYEQGLTIPDTATAIREGMKDASEFRSTMIARTEMQALASGGSHAAMQIVAEETGIEYQKVWLTAPGADHPRHEEYDDLDGQTVALDDYFDVGGAKLAYPSDPDGPPEETIQCRCTLSYVERAAVADETEPPDLDETADELASVESAPIGGDDSMALAASVVARAVAIEPKLTEIMRAVVLPRGGVLEGLPFRLKSEASMDRKIKLVAAQARIPVKAAAHAMKDGNRYTAVFGPADYAVKTRSTLDALRRAGLEPERVSAAWGPGRPYVGTNVILRAPNGVRLELQFHTPESLRTKQIVNHPLYERWRTLDAGSAEARELEAQMTRNADRVYRPPGMGDFRYEPSVEADVGITPFRAGDDPIGFYDSDKFKRFEADVEHAAQQYGVEVEEQRKVGGVWEGEQEPAVALRVHDGELGVRAFAADLGKAYDQDGVLLFTAKNGEDVVATFGTRRGLTEANVYDAMKQVDLPAGRFLEDGRLQVIGSGPDFVAQLDRLAARLGTGYDADVGEFRLLEKGKGDYEASIRDFGSAPGEQVRASERAASRDRSAPALEARAEGRQGLPAEVAVPPPPPDVAKAATLPQPAVPPVPKPLTPLELKRLSVDGLWNLAGELGRIENIARAEVADAAQKPLYEALWQRGEGRLRKDLLHYDDLAGDQQVHSIFSDGHKTIGEMAEEARLRGQRQLVLSDHSHLLTPADIAKQHADIDHLNGLYKTEGIDFRVVKGVEVNILADGTLDTASEVLSQFDIVNASIHAAQSGPGALLPTTERFLKAMDNPNLNVLVHPHSVDADWNLVAKKAAEKGIALEVNGRDMLRNGRQDAAAAMIAAAKRAGAKLAIGSDAHTASDLVDALYAVRFAAQHGVTPEDIWTFQRRLTGPALPADVSLVSKTDGGFLGAEDDGIPGVSSLGGGMAKVYRVDIGDKPYVLKIPKTDDELVMEFGVGSAEDSLASRASGFRLRDNIEPGNDIAREKAAYTMAKFFNEVGGDQFRVYTPAVADARATIATGPVVSTAGETGGILPVYEGSKTVAAEVQDFVAGTVAANSDVPLQRWTTGALHRQETRSAALYDAIIGNTDRHVGNFLFGDDDHLWLIDHGLSFPDTAKVNSYENNAIVDYAASAFKRALTPTEADFLERLKARKDEIGLALADDGLSRASIDRIWERIDYMLEENSRRGWPHGADLLGPDGF